MNVIIIEDEHHNYKMLRGMIEKYRPHWKINGPFESVEKSVSWLSANQAPDLIFMDIQLIDGICFSIFEEIELESMVIFTTAYDEYALQAFEVNSIDYLLKPIKDIKLQNAIDRFELFYNNKEQNSSKVDYNEVMKAIVNGEKKYRSRFLVANAASYYKINTCEIALFHTENRLTYAITFAGKRHTIDITMEKLEGQLNPETFFRANRSTIVHSDAIRKIENYFGGKLYVHLIPPLRDQITISRLKATEFKNWLDK